MEWIEADPHPEGFVKFHESILIPHEMEVAKYHGAVPDHAFLDVMRVLANVRELTVDVLGG